MEAFGVRSAPVARRIAVVSTDSSVLPALEEHIVPIFHTTVLESPEHTLGYQTANATEALIYDLEVAEQATEDGLQQIAVFRENHPELIIIAVTRSSGRAAAQKAKNAGSDEVFQAPGDIAKLGEVLGSLLTKREEQNVAALIQKEMEGRFRFKDLL